MNDSKNIRGYQVYLNRTHGFDDKNASVEDKAHAYANGLLGIEVTANDGTKAQVANYAQLSVLLSAYNEKQQEAIKAKSGTIFKSYLDFSANAMQDINPQTQQAIINQTHSLVDAYNKKGNLGVSSQGIVNDVEQAFQSVPDTMTSLECARLARKNGKRIANVVNLPGLQNLIVPVREENEATNPFTRTMALKREKSKKFKSFWTKPRVAAASLALMVTASLAGCGLMNARNTNKDQNTNTTSIAHVDQEKEELTAEQAAFLQNKDAFCTMTDEIAARMPDQLINIDTGESYDISSIKHDLAISGREYTALFFHFVDRSSDFAPIAFDSYDQASEEFRMAVDKLSILAQYMNEKDITLFDHLFTNPYDQEVARKLQTNIANRTTDVDAIMSNINDMYDSPSGEMRSFVVSYAYKYFANMAYINENDVNRYNYTGVLDDTKVPEGMRQISKLEETYCGNVQGGISTLATQKFTLEQMEKEEGLFKQEDDKLNEKHDHRVNFSLNRIFTDSFVAQKIARGLWNDETGLLLSAPSTVTETVTTTWTESVPGGVVLEAETEANRQRAIQELKDKAARGELPGIDPSTIGQVSGNEKETIEEVGRQEGDVVYTKPDLVDKTDGPSYTKDENGNFVAIPGTDKPAQPGDKPSGGFDINDLIDQKEQEAASGQTTGGQTGTPETPAPTPEPQPETPAPETPAPQPDPEPQPETPAPETPAPQPDPEPPKETPELSGGGIVSVEEGPTVYEAPAPEVATPAEIAAYVEEMANQDSAMNQTEEQAHTK